MSFWSRLGSRTLLSPHALGLRKYVGGLRTFFFTGIFNGCHTCGDEPFSSCSEAFLRLTFAICPRVQFYLNEPVSYVSQIFRQWSWIGISLISFSLLKGEFTPKNEKSSCLQPLFAMKFQKNCKSKMFLFFCHICNLYLSRFLPGHRHRLRKMMSPTDWKNPGAAPWKVNNETTQRTLWQHQWWFYCHIGGSHSCKPCGQKLYNLFRCIISKNFMSP